MDRRFYTAPQNQNNAPNVLPDYQESGHLPVTDQSLADAFSYLSVSPAAQPLLPINDNGLYAVGRRQGNVTDVSLQNLRFQHSQMGSGVGPRNPIVGPDVFPAYSPAPVTAALLNNYQAVPSGVYRDNNYDLQSFQNSRMLYDLSSLNHKKQLLLYHLNKSQNTSPPIVANGSGANNAFRRLNNTRSTQLYDYVNLRDMKGMILSYATDQNWCKVLQSKFTNPTQEDIEMVLSEVIDCMDVLMKNPFGNYLALTLIDVCNEEQRNRIIMSITKSTFLIVDICCSPHGTRAVQKLVDRFSSPQQVVRLMAVISSGAAVLAIDQHGHHVIQHCLTHFTTEDNMHLINNLADNCYKVAIDRSGCCVLQICVEKHKGPVRQRLISELLANAVHLSRDPYGNYVLQHLLGLKEPEIKVNLLKQLEGEFMPTACDKYGSNVVEKFLESGEEYSSRIIMELVGDPNASMILLDPYGNYVIQSALAVSQGLPRNALIRLINANASTMRSNLYGRKIIACLEKKKNQLI